MYKKEFRNKLTIYLKLWHACTWPYFRQQWTLELDSLHFCVLPFIHFHPSHSTVFESWARIRHGKSVGFEIIIKKNIRTGPGTWIPSRLYNYKLYQPDGSGRRWPPANGAVLTLFFKVRNFLVLSESELSAIKKFASSSNILIVMTFLSEQQTS